MISTPTTFVVGAGASVPFGLPTAKDLLSQARNLTPRSNLYQALDPTVEGGPTSLNSLIEDLQAHPARSIDAFLESRSDLLDTGKRLIAALMGRAVLRSAKKAVDNEQDWLADIIEEMRDGARTWRDFSNGNTDVTFVTFNFDSTIETRLRAAIKAIYQVTDEQANQTVEMRGIAHIHGTLPPLKRTVTPGWIAEAGDAINVTMDRINMDVLRFVRAKIQESQVLCFLGFSFHKENLKRLYVDSMNPPHEQEVYGSAYGLRDGERQRIANRFGNKISLARENQDCRDTLMSFQVFRD